jgi:ferrochelatase
MRVAVVLFNLGGPGSLDEVKPFLFNLFNDPAIIRLPNPLRWLVAKLISSRRAPVAREIYKKLGGSSPILGQTYNQASALQSALQGTDDAIEVFVAMRYSSPRASDVVEQVRRFRPERIVLLPLYPQFSTTTSRSSIREWQEQARARKLDAPTVTLCCYATDSGFVEAYADLIRETLKSIPPGLKYRLLFSAHGLPENVVKGGDPYQAQVEQSAAAIAGALAMEGLDWRISYQSRVGPLKWIGPATETEIEDAGKEARALVVVPIAFVSEHSETLVELDIEYAEKAHESGVPHYARVPAVGTHAAFVKGLAGLVTASLSRTGTSSGSGKRVCPGTCSQCAMQEKAA